MLSKFLEGYCLLDYKEITNVSQCKGLKELYIEAFPHKERIPVWLLNLLAKRKCVSFFAFYDHDALCGMSYLITYDDITFILYLATDVKLRSKGYGSQILQWIISHSSPVVVLNIESLDEITENYEQKLRRQRFYFKNGFRDTGKNLTDSGGNFDILFYGRSFDAERYNKLLKHYSLGLYKAVIS